MRHIAFFALAAFAAASTSAAEPAGKPAKAQATAPSAPAAPATNESCLECHSIAKRGDTDAVGRQGILATSFASSVHKDLSCVDCHAGYTVGPHELQPPAEAKDAALLQKLSSAKTVDDKVVIGSPRAYLACGNCHSGVWEDLAASPHGKWLAGKESIAGPVCASCHGSPHEVTPAPEAKNAAALRAYKAAESKRCEGCHGDPKFAEAARLPAEVALNYNDSIHGRLVALGSPRAPLCTDCHGWLVAKSGHKSIAGGKVAGSAVFFSDPPRKDDARVRACGQCHAASNPNFAALVAHKAWQETHAVPHVVHVAFSWLTTLTLLFFAFHVLIDFIYEIRQRFARRDHADDADAHREVLRFDIHQRIQHWLMLSGVILLGLTGWPLRGAGAMNVGDAAQRIESSRKFLALFGGPHGAGIVHRIAAMMIIASGIYHLVYLGTLAAKKRLPLSMLPTPKDAFDMRDNIMFLLGLRKERPKFDRYMYLEKFDYWAVFWGIVMMVGSGFIFWFPARFAQLLPTYVITAAQIIHGEEATLAILFLFVVHFYNVHLKPSIFPMNWAWLTGHISVEMQKEEHPLEYERMMQEGKDGGPR
jgi:cytochrome b subunit of formate dehydrogenase